MRSLVFSFLLVAAATGVSAGAPRFIVDDDAYAAQVSRAGEKLLHAHKLVALTTLRSEIRSAGLAFGLPAVSHEKLEPPDLCDRLRESTLAIGTLYKCPDCGGWHFSSSSGFVVNENGIVCTCCHVILEEDDQIKESYLIAADPAGHVFPVKAVLAADTDADSCLLKIEATGLKPLPLRAGARPGESVFCLSNPGGYFFMFTQGMIARLNRRTNAEPPDDHGHSHKSAGRPVMLLNITAEFAPGSSGAPVVDSCGNVVGQVASIADAGEPGDQSQTLPASPSVPVRFCTAAEEILRLVTPNLARESHGSPLRQVKKSKLKKMSPRPGCPRPNPSAQSRLSGIPGEF